MISKTTHQQQEEPALSFSIGKIIAMVRKGGFEKSFPRTLNDLQGTWTPCLAA